MQLLLGLFFFSVLLTAGSTLQCVKCIGINGYCSDVKEECPTENDVCASLVVMNKLKKEQINIKKCSRKDECKQFELLIGNENISTHPDIPDGTVITEVTCSKAPPSFASFFPAFLGLLLTKLLF